MAFVMNKTSKIVLYGAGERGKTIYDYLIKNQYNVSFILDRNPQKVKMIYECPVINVEDIAQKCVQETIFIICLQNGLLHDEVAHLLNERGYSKILFLPTANKYQRDHEMRSCYQKLLEDMWDENEQIPEYPEMELGRDKNIIIDDGEMITCWVNMEYIFSYDAQEKNDETWFNRHISFLSPYITLFDYIRGQAEYPREYLESFRGSNLEEQNKLLLDRVKLWNMYEEKINTDSSYFTSAYIFAKWEDNHFSIMDGHHRAVYLFMKDWYEIPIRMSKKDYIAYSFYKDKQEWEQLERSVKRAYFKMCIKLSRWIETSGTYFYKVCEKGETKGYFTNWLKTNHIGDQIENTSKAMILDVCIDSEFKVDECNKNSVIIAYESKDEKMKEEVILHTGFLGEKKEKICIYGVGK